MRYMLLIYPDDQALGKTTAREHCYVESAQLAGLLDGNEVQTLVKFVNLPSPHPLPSPLGRGWPQAG
ncbi:MAG: hypothetical protein DMG05_30555 [Acidobacteria bacterium]|nr:MAG: hypothetical protein DMG05_30555 [Acidobacteriota bacterium]